MKIMILQQGLELKAQIMKMKKNSLKKTLKSWLKHLIIPCSMKHHECHYMKEQHNQGWLPHYLSLIVVTPMELVML
jgi:hypothetical protein